MSSARLTLEDNTRADLCLVWPLTRFLEVIDLLSGVHGAGCLPLGAAGWRGRSFCLCIRVSHGFPLEVARVGRVIVLDELHESTSQQHIAQRRHHLQQQQQQQRAVKRVQWPQHLSELLQSTL